MRTLVLTTIIAICALQSSAQHVATFEDLSLSKADTFYLNYGSPGNDVGFTDSFLRFPCVYDTIFGGIWENGFAYSNKTDSVTSGYMNPYSAKTAAGYSGSANYLVCNMTGGMPGMIYMTDTSKADSVYGFYVTNGTYPYNAMRDGDGFSKKFGGVSGNDSDWFTLTVMGYHNGTLINDSVVFFLADFRTPGHTSADYIVNTWQWVDLKKFGKVDSLTFKMNSSDVGSFGINTPLYFCADNFTTNVKKPVGIENTPTVAAAKIYPIPANDKLFVELADMSVKELSVFDMTGKIVATYVVTATTTTINTATLAVGTYILKLSGNQTATVRFTKQ